MEKKTITNNSNNNQNTSFETNEINFEQSLLSFVLVGIFFLRHVLKSAPLKTSLYKINGNFRFSCNERKKIISRSKVICSFHENEKVILRLEVFIIIEWSCVIVTFNVINLFCIEFF